VLTKTILYAAMSIIAIAITVEISFWMKGSKLVGKAQKAYRISAAAMLEAVLFIILYSKSIADWNLKYQIGFWGVATALSFAILAIGMLDVKATLNAYREQRKEIFGNLSDRERRKE